MNGFKDKTVIITGASRGIGRACALAFAKEQANVVFTYNKSKKYALSLKRELKACGGKFAGIQSDVKEYAECRTVVEKAVKKFGHIDILVNNAGVLKDRALVMMTPDDWREVIDTNLCGTFNMSRSCITSFLKQKSGCIINMSSVSGLVGIARQTNYSASKAGIIGFSRSLAREVAGYNVRVNVVCPGFIETDMVLSLSEDIKKNIIKSIPARRLGHPGEVAELCVFLSSDKARYITGEVIKIDGALTA